MDSSLALLLARNTECPLSAKLSIMPSAVLSRSPSGLWVWVPVPFCSRTQAPETTNVLAWIFRAYSVTLREFAIFFLYFLVLSNQCHCTLTWRWSFLWSFEVLKFTINSVITFWISSQNSLCGESWEICPLELPSAPRRSDPNLWDNVFPKSIESCISQTLTGSSLIPPRQSTESEKDVSLGSCKLNSSVSWQSSVSPQRLLPVNRGQTTNFCLICDQPLSHLKELLQRLQKVDSW